MLTGPPVGIKFPHRADKNIKAFVHLHDGETNLFAKVGRVLQTDSLRPYLFIICLDYKQIWGKILLTSVNQIKENGFTFLKKSKKQMISDRNYDKYGLRR